MVTKKWKQKTKKGEKKEKAITNVLYGLKETNIFVLLIVYLFVCLGFMAYQL